MSVFLSGYVSERIRQILPNKADLPNTWSSCLRTTLTVEAILDFQHHEEWVLWYRCCTMFREIGAQAVCRLFHAYNETHLFVSIMFQSPQSPECVPVSKEAIELLKLYEVVEPVRAYRVFEYVLDRKLAFEALHRDELDEEYKNSKYYAIDNDQPSQINPIQ